MNDTTSQLVDPGKAYTAPPTQQTCEAEPLHSVRLIFKDTPEELAVSEIPKEQTEQITTSNQPILNKENKNLIQKAKEKPVNVLTVPVNPDNPQQNTFEFSDIGITISSDFDSGNLAKCKQNADDPYHFHMQLAGDGLPYSKVGHYKTWFYFSVKGIKNGDTLTFNVKNMAHQGKLYKAGLKPVFRILPNAKKWKRCGGKVTWSYTNDGFSLTWTHHFNVFNEERDDTAYFAWTYPYSFQDTLKKTRKLVKRFENHEKIYIHREILYYSREHRPMEMITFSDRCGITEEREETIEGLFPEHSTTDDSKMRPFKFDKETIFLSCRVHPGETPASYVLNGIWNFITNEKSEQARILRERFVFKVVPVLNPDGVYRGYFRLDTLAQNLNRYYSAPTSDKQPTIWAVKNAIDQQQKYGKLAIYVDLHAHASKRGCFMFGNNLTGEQQLKNMLLPKLVSLNSLNFDFLECNFSDKLMQCKDKKDGLTREGCGRVSIMKLTGLANCYTLECNYASGRRINHIASKQNANTGQQEPEIPITDAKHRFYTENCVGNNANGSVSTLKQSPAYTIEVFEDIGRAFCIGLLDFYECNPISRLPLSIYKNIDGVRQDILSHNPIFLPKKKELEKKTHARNGLNSKAGGTRSMGGSNSLQRNQTQKGQLSAAPTGDTSQSTSATAINQSFANRLSQKQAAMVKQSSQVSENDEKIIINSRRSKQKEDTEDDPNFNLKSANNSKENKELKNFVRQRPLAAQKNPNLNQNNRSIYQNQNHKIAPSSGKNPVAGLLTRSEKNFNGLSSNQTPFPMYYQHMQEQIEKMPPIKQKNNRTPFIDSQPEVGHCSDFSSGCASNAPSIYEHEDDIMYQRQYNKNTKGHPSENARSLNSSEELSDSSASACADEPVMRSIRKKQSAKLKEVEEQRKQLIPPSRTDLREKSHENSPATLSPALIIKSARQSMYNKPTPPPRQKYPGQVEQLFVTDNNLVGQLADQFSEKEKNSDKWRLVQKEQIVTGFPPKPQNILNHQNQQQIVRSCSQTGVNTSQCKQNISEVCSQENGFEQYSHLKEEGRITQSLFPHRADQINPNRFNQNHSSINASEYVATQASAPLHHQSIYKAGPKRQSIRQENKNNQRPLYHEPAYKFDRGDSDLVKSIAQSTSTSKGMSPALGIMTNTSFLKTQMGPSVAIKNQELDVQTIQDKDFTRQQFSLMKKLMNKSTKPIQKLAAELVEQRQFSQEFGSPVEFIAEQQKDGQLKKLILEQRRISECQGQMMKHMSANYSSTKHQQQHKKQVDGINSSQANLGNPLIIEHGFEMTESTSAVISSNILWKFSNNRNANMSGSGQQSSQDQSANNFCYFNTPTAPDIASSKNKQNNIKISKGLSSNSPAQTKTPKGPNYLPGNQAIQEQQLVMQQQQLLKLRDHSYQGGPNMDTEEFLFPQISHQQANPPICVMQNQTKGPIPQFNSMRKAAAVKKQHQEQALLINQNRSLSLLRNQGMTAPTCAFPAQFKQHIQPNQGHQAQALKIQKRSTSNKVPKPHGHLNRQSKSPRGSLQDQKEFHMRIEPVSEKAGKIAKPIARRKRNTLALANEASQCILLDQNMQIEGTQQSQLYQETQYHQGPRKHHQQRGPPPPDNWKSSSQKF